MSFPNLTDPFTEWETATDFKHVQKTVEDFEVTETSAAVYFSAIFYPADAQKINFKPEGQRQWRWWTMLAKKKLALDDIIENRDTVQYRIMAVKDWSMAGYYEYDITENFTT
jgi:hypothetical protein